MQRTPHAHAEIDEHAVWFKNHVEAYLTGEPDNDEHIGLKLEHSLMVLEEARLIATEEALPQPTARLGLLAALYHDLGRFDQYRLYKTFKDALSENHAVLGVKALRATAVLSALDRRERAVVAGAVAMHNRRRVPERLAPELGCLTRLVRDADKLDIIRIMLDHMRPGGKRSDVVTLHVADEPDKYTTEIVEEIMSRRIGDYAHMRYVNDFCLLLVSWVYDLNFAASRRAFLDRHHLDELFAILPRTAELTRLKDRIYTDLTR